jgi:hypothetical protein
MLTEAAEKRNVNVNLIVPTNDNDTISNDLLSNELLVSNPKLE